MPTKKDAVPPYSVLLFFLRKPRVCGRDFIPDDGGYSAWAVSAARLAFSWPATFSSRLPSSL